MSPHSLYSALEIYVYVSVWSKSDHWFRRYCADKAFSIELYDPGDLNNRVKVMKI